MALKTVKIEPGAAPASAPETAPTGAAPPAPAAAGAGKGGLRKNILIGVAAVAAVAVIWMGGDWFFNGRFNISTDNAQLRSDIARVTPKIEGYVKTIHVAENQVVKRGDLLVRIGYRPEVRVTRTSRG